MKREQVLPHVMADMAARIAKGAAEYGEPLTTFNGRDALQDAYEEQLDQCLYLKQALMERDGAGILQQMNLRAAKHAKEQLLTRGEWEAIAQKERTDAALEVAPEPWPGPDWSQAPEWAMWWAADKNGRSCWHKLRPDIDPDDPEWLQNANPGKASEYRTIEHNFGHTGDWRDSLRKRPE